MTQERFDSRSKRQPKYYVDESADDAANTAETIASRTLDDADRVIAKGRVGEPAEEIIESAKRLEPRYLVLGGRKRLPVGKALFGSITQSILLKVGTPTVTVMRD